MMSGTAEVFHEGESGATEHLGHLGAGEFFGELGVASHGRRSAHVVAAEPLSCLVLSATQPERGWGAETPVSWRGQQGASEHLGQPSLVLVWSPASFA